MSKFCKCGTPMSDQSQKCHRCRDYMPTPEQLAESIREVQTHWSRSEFARRLGEVDYPVDVCVSIEGGQHRKGW